MEAPAALPPQAWDRVLLDVAVYHQRSPGRIIYMDTLACNARQVGYLGMGEVGMGSFFTFTRCPRIEQNSQWLNHNTSYCGTFFYTQIA